MARFSTTRAEAGLSRSATWTTGTFSPPSRISEVKRKRFPSGRKNGQPCQEKRSFSGASTGASAPPAAFTRWIAPAIETRMTPSRLQVPPRPGPRAASRSSARRPCPRPPPTGGRRTARRSPSRPGDKKNAARPVRAREESRLEARQRSDEDAVLRRVRLVESHEAAVGRQRHPRPLRVPGFEGEVDHPRTGPLGDPSPRGGIAPPRRGRARAATARPAGAAARGVRAVVVEDCASANRSGRRRTRASPMSRRRSFGSRSRQRSSRRRTRPGCLGGQRRPLRLAGQDRGEHVAHRLALEELAAGQHLEEHDPEGPDVGPPVDRLAAGLLRRHVGGGAEDEAGRGAGVGERRGLRQVGRRGARALPRLGEAEVENRGLAVGSELDVRRLEVAVDDALLVGLFERLGDLPRDRDGLVDGNRPALQALREVFPLDELHGEDALAGDLLQAEEGGDVRMREGGEDLRLALEAGESVGVGGERLGQQLQRDVAPEPGVGRAPDLAHAPRAEGRDDRVGSEVGPRFERQGVDSDMGRPVKSNEPCRCRLLHLDRLVE